MDAVRCGEGRSIFLERVISGLPRRTLQLSSDPYPSLPGKGRNTPVTKETGAKRTCGINPRWSN